VHNPALSDEENTALFGKCNHPNWHGHNYVLEVSVTGPIDPRSGYVMDLGHLKTVVESKVIDQLDHRNLNVDVPFLAGANPTSENLVVACWREIAPLVPWLMMSAITAEAASPIARDGDFAGLAPAPFLRATASLVDWIAQRTRAIVSVIEQEAQ
jgi:6-pyruvoyltetrahydropterin/6-carboxytetrahydropterin synthase